MVIAWEDPTPDPRQTAGKHDWAGAADELRQRPFVWAKIAENVSSWYTTGIKRGEVRAFAPAGQFKATSRKNPKTGNYDIFAMYAPEAPKRGRPKQKA